MEGKENHPFTWLKIQIQRLCRDRCDPGVGMTAGKPLRALLESLVAEHLAGGSSDSSLWLASHQSLPAAAGRLEVVMDNKQNRRTSSVQRIQKYPRMGFKNCNMMEYSKYISTSLNTGIWTSETAWSLSPHVWVHVSGGGLTLFPQVGLLFASKLCFYYM